MVSALAKNVQLLKLSYKAVPRKKIKMKGSLQPVRRSIFEDFCAVARRTQAPLCSGGVVRFISSLEKELVSADVNIVWSLRASLPLYGSLQVALFFNEGSRNT